MFIELNQEQADRIYSMLEKTVRANEYDRYNFVLTVSSRNNVEYRLNSALGFGGKLYNNSNGLYIDCYPEDYTDIRIKMIGAANEALKEMVTKKKESA